jgi:hypothetical protein
MNISAHNPYEKNGVEIDLEEAEQKLLFRKKVEWKPQQTDKVHIVEVGETMDSIAHLYYSPVRSFGGRYWWLITDANKIHNPLDISAYVGRQLVIPDIKILDFLVK